MKHKPKQNLHLHPHDGPVYFREVLAHRKAGASLDAARAAGRAKLFSFREEIKNLPPGGPHIGKTNELKKILGI